MTTITQRVIDRARAQYGVTVYTHEQWGAKRQDVYAWRRANKPVRVKKADTLVQHITVTRPSGDVKADARTVEQIGYDRFRSGVSYNWLVDMTTGEVCAGQPLDAKGTHTVNDKRVAGYSYDQNHAARAIAVIGMPDTKLSAKAQAAIAGLIAAMMDEDAITESPDYVPHSLFAYKDCPCGATRSAMPAMLRTAKQRRAEGSKPAPKPKPVVKAKSRGNNVDDAIAAGEKALAYAKEHGLTTRAEIIANGLCWFKQIEER